MEPISSIGICLETANDVELVAGEEGIETIKYMKTASGIEVLTNGSEGEFLQGWPWSSIQSYSIQK